MAVNDRPSLAERTKNVLLRQPKPFSSKRDINWKLIGWILGGGICFSIFVLLLMPTPESKVTEYTQKEESDQSGKVAGKNSADPWANSQSAAFSPQTNEFIRNPFYDFGSSGSAASSKNHNSAMILGRPGYDAKTQLPPGARLQVSLSQRVVVERQAMPVIGTVTADVIQESSVAVPKDSKVYGDISFDEFSERALISWNSIILPDGRQRELSALTIGTDEEAGVGGKVRSEAFKNVVGQSLSHFIAAYAQGSMTRNQMGFSQGGSDNGLKNAVAATAQDRADAWAEDLKKTRKWIEVSEGTPMIAVLKEKFTFRDPGEVH